MKKVYEIANPLQVRHFLFRFPLLSKKRKDEAVNFSLRNSFPYSMEDMQVDYFDEKKRTFAFVCRKSVCETLKKKNINIISICFLLRKKFKDSIVFCFFSNCLFVQKNSGGKTLAIKTLRYENLNEDDLEDFLKERSKIVFFKTSDCPSAVLKRFTFINGREIELIETLVKGKSAGKNILFSGKKFSAAGLTAGLVLLAASLTLHFSVRREWEEKKAAHENCLRQIQEFRKTSFNNQKETVLLSIPLILEHISHFDDCIDIKTFRFSSGDVHAEATVSDAEKFVMLLKNDEVLRDARIENISVKDKSEEVSFSFKVNYEE